MRNCRVTKCQTAQEVTKNVTRAHHTHHRHGIEPTYSAREAAVLLGRSYSWLDQRVRKDQFVLPDGTVVRPLRTPGGYRRFTTAMLKDIAICCHKHHWFSMGEAQVHLRELLVASYRDTGEYKIPS